MSIEHPLYKWLSEGNKDFGEFAKSIGLTSEKSLYRYFSGDRIPSRKVMPKIEEMTDRKITASHFYGGVQ